MALTGKVTSVENDPANPGFKIVKAFVSGSIPGERNLQEYEVIVDWSDISEEDRPKIVEGCTIQIQYGEQGENKLNGRFKVKVFD